MGIAIQERFEIAAPPERVWEYLIDAARVVRCLPGAELLETAADGSFVGRVKVKVGPVVAAYRGKARFVELDPAARRARLTGEGQEASGAGSARMVMTSAIAALPGGGSAVQVDVDVDVVGKLAQFGRGMIEEVSRQLFKQFAACVRAALEPAAEAAASSRAAGAPATTATGSSSAAGAPATAASAPSPAEPLSSPVAASGSAPPAPAAASDTPAPPLRILPVLFAALRAWLKRLFRPRANPAA